MRIVARVHLAMNGREVLRVRVARCVVELVVTHVTFDAYCRYLLICQFIIMSYRFL